MQSIIYAKLNVALSALDEAKAARKLNARLSAYQNARDSVQAALAALPPAYIQPGSHSLGVAINNIDRAMDTRWYELERRNNRAAYMNIDNAMRVMEQAKRWYK